MKLRHAAALALVGWFLMLAPRTSDSLPVTYDTSVPLNTWTRIGSYDTPAECDEGKKEVPAEILQAEAGRSEEQKKLANETIVNLLKASTCIATDDPRLKPN